MKKRTFGKLNMVLSTRVALVLALMLALTGCSSAKATPSNPASSGASVGTTSETTTPQSTPSSNASTTDAGNDTTPVETSSDATELAEANQNTPSSSITSGSRDAADYWVSDTEFDLISYLKAWGFQKVYDTNSSIVAKDNINSSWTFDLFPENISGYNTPPTIMAQGVLRDRPSAFESITLESTGKKIEITGTDLSLDKSMIEAIIKIMPFSNQQFELGFHLQDLL